MMDLTEQQEQEMIERAKAGDPEANYQMSLWALDQAIAEPDEERWNRLAAKCLVKAAEAGYEPAKEKMNELLVQTAEAQPPVSGQSAAPAAETTSSPQPEAAPAADTPAAQTSVTGGTGAAKRDIIGTVRNALSAFAAKVKGLLPKKKSDGAEAGGEPKADGEKKAGIFNFSQWDDAKWKKMQIICIVICVILVLLIVISLLTKDSKKDTEPEEVVPTVPVEMIATPVPTPTPEPAYPDEATKEEIAAANLDVFPEDGDYVTAPKKVTVSTSGSVLNLRRGPGQNYGQVSSIDNGTSTDVYAYKNGWALVKHNDVWGWCSNDYLK